MLQAVNTKEKYSLHFVPKVTYSFNKANITKLSFNLTKENRKKMTTKPADVAPPIILATNLLVIGFYK